jgi:hypothetical protein
MCYRFELLEFDDCLFENVDATYILHLEGNGRIDHIHEQLKTYHPSKKVYIVYNKGYTCKKKIKEKTSGYDLIHANMTVFEHAQQYKHVLVLEDDFIFSKDIKKHAIHVDNFLKRDASFVYQLGSTPVYAIPVEWYHYRISGGTAHSNIYSSSARKLFLDDYISKKHTIENMDYYVSTLLTMYMYHKPLCYQTFPKTENRKNWTRNFPDTISKMLDFLMDTFISCTNLENKPEPGFSILYFLAKMVPFLVLFLLVWILRYLSCLSCKSGLKGKRVR